MTDDFPVPAGKQKLNNKHINLARTIRMPTLGPSHGVNCEVN